MAKKPKRRVTAAEKGDGDFGSKFGNTEFIQHVRTRTAPDGIETTYTDFKPRQKKSYSYPGSPKS